MRQLQIIKLGRVTIKDLLSLQIFCLFFLFKKKKKKKKKVAIEKCNEERTKIFLFR